MPDPDHNVAESDFAGSTTELVPTRRYTFTESDV